MQFYRGHLIAYSLGNFANFHNFGGGGILSESAILHVTLTATGGFVTGQLHSVVLDSEGRASLGGASIGTVRSLSKQDFGTHAARLSHTGVIRQRSNNRTKPIGSSLSSHSDAVLSQPIQSVPSM